MNSIYHPLRIYSIGLALIGALATLHAQTVEAPASLAADVRASMTWEGCSRPKYPRDSLVRNEAGTVRLKFHVGADSAIIDSGIARSSGFPSLDNAALVAIAKCKFYAAIENGKPVTSSILVEYKFTLVD